MTVVSGFRMNSSFHHYETWGRFPLFDNITQRKKKKGKKDRKKETKKLLSFNSAL